MAKAFGLLHLSLLLFATLFAHGQEAVHLSIIYDNYQVDDRLETDWGFACLVEFRGQKLLFDAGRNTKLYQKNMGMLDIKPGESFLQTAKVLPNLPTSMVLFIPLEIISRPLRSRAW